MNRDSLSWGTAALCLGLGMIGVAEATTSEALHFENATGFCQAALPVFEGSIRKRPTAVANEGASNVFVSCSMPTSAEITTGVEEVALVLYNNSAATVNVTCSLVHDFRSGGLIVPKTWSIPPGSRRFFEWTLANILNPESFAFANFSCNLPAGVEIGYGFYYYNYEIGN